VLLEDVIEDGDRIAGLIRDRVCHRDSDAEVELLAGSVWTVRWQDHTRGALRQPAGPVRGKRVQSAVAGSGCQAGELSSLYGISVVSSATSTIRRTLCPLLRIT
jgi:hypothetical protein